MPALRPLKSLNTSSTVRGLFCATPPSIFFKFYFTFFYYDYFYYYFLLLFFQSPKIRAIKERLYILMTGEGRGPEGKTGDLEDCEGYF